MVYRGKPSSGCEPCRKRRAKCDRRKPGCGQCVRKAIKCPGYRDLLDLHFQDETQVVLHKQWRKEQSRHSPASRSTSSTDSVSPPAAPPAISLRDYALAFFTNIYIPTSPFDYLSEHYDLRLLFDTPPSLDGSPLPAAIQAAAFACLSLDQPRPFITLFARKYYTVALHSTNHALASASLGPPLLDSTLISVLLLGLFESIFFRGRASPTSWTAHAHGALALLRLGGASQFSTPLGRALFVHASATINASFLRRGEAVPAAMRKLYDYAPPDMEQHPSIGLGRMMGRLAELRVAGRRMMEGGAAAADNMDGAIDLLRDVVAMEAALERYGQQTPRAWWGVVPPERAPPHAFRRHAHTYVAHMAARMWISMRLARLALNEKVWPSCRRLLALNDLFGGHLFPGRLVMELEGMRDAACARGRELILDSLAVVPYFWDPRSDRPAKGFAARLLIWPLSIAAQSEFCDSETREYAIATLRSIGEGESFPQATEAARMLEEGGLPEDWLHLWHLA